MILHRSLFPAGLLALAALVTSTKNAEACSGPLCWGGFMAPSQGDVPASLPAVVWVPHKGNGGTPDASGAEMVRITPNGEVPVAVNVTLTEAGVFLVSPAAALDPDADYEVRGASYCDTDGQSAPTVASLHTTAAADIPGTLGSVSAAAPSVGSIEVTTVSGSCSAPITAAQAEIDIALSAEAQPWAQALLYQTHVDGKLWSHAGYYPLGAGPGSPFRAGSKDVVFAYCEGDDPGADKGLSEGEHTIVMRATLPGTDLALETEPVTVTLDCTPEVDPGPGPGPGPDTDPDTNTPPDSSNTDTDDASGGCSAAGSAPKPGGGAGLWLLAAGAAVLSMARGRGSRRQVG